jgi:hypothetical protein
VLIILYFDIFWISPNLGKFTYGLFPLEQPHKIEKKKEKKTLIRYKLVGFSKVFFFVLAILYYSQNGDDSQEDLAKFEYRRNMKLQYWKASFYILGYLLKTMHVKSWRVCLNLGRTFCQCFWRKNIQICQILMFSFRR